MTERLTMKMSSDEESDMDNVPLIEQDFVKDVRTSDRKSSKWELLLFTVPFSGLQIAWSVQQVFGVPYLSSMGINDAQIPLFVMSGPVAGIIVPPIVAALSDASYASPDRRKPFIYAGGCGTILSFLLLAAAEPIGVTFSYSLLGTVSTSTTRTVTNVVAGISIYALNFSIQPLALGLRASVIDHFQPSEQPRANLWVGLFSSLGSILVALVGLGYSPDFRVLAFIASGLIAVMLLLVASTKHTTPMEREGMLRKPRRTTAYRHFVDLLTRVRHLPIITRWTCKMQLGSWFAWFFVLNYTSVIVSRIYQKPETTVSDQLAFGKTVAGVALLFHISSLLSLIFASTVLQGSQSRTTPAHYKDEHSVESLGTVADVPSEKERAKEVKDEETAKFSTSLQDEPESLAGSSLDYRQNTLVRRVWKPALVCLAASITVTTVLAAVAPQSSVAATAASILLGANGALFGLSNWVPYALIAYESAMRVRSQLLRKTQRERQDTASISSGSRSDSLDLVDEKEHDRTTSTWKEDDECDDTDETPMVLAVHNIAITLPQVAAAVVSCLLINALHALGIQQSTWWIYALSVPAALWAACL